MVFLCLYKEGVSIAFLFHSLDRTMGCHEFINSIRSLGNALCFICCEYSATPLALSPVFLRRRSNFPMQRQRHPAAQPPFYFLFMRDFQTKAVLVLLFFKFNDAKTKTPSSSTSFALSLLAYLSFPIQCNPYSFPLCSPR